jgi:epoxyqueuosine reductase
MGARQPFPTATLDHAGLNRQHVFDLADLPADVVATLAPAAGERQLILLGHGGRRLWECIQAAGVGGDNPIDDYAVEVIAGWFAEHLPGARYRILYPGDHPVGLRRLGQLAGWHHASPLMLGIDSEWGTWYAYRAVVLADTDFCPSAAVDRNHPCAGCRARPCVGACPADALAGGSFSLKRCIAHRTAAGSGCRPTCIARLACPVGSEHRYDEGQMRYAYGISLAMLGANG